MRGLVRQLQWHFFSIHEAGMKDLPLGYIWLVFQQSLLQTTYHMLTLKKIKHVNKLLSNSTIDFYYLII